MKKQKASSKLSLFFYLVVISLYRLTTHSSLKPGPQLTNKPTIVSREESLGAKLYQKDKPKLDVTLKELEV